MRHNGNAVRISKNHGLYTAEFSGYNLLLEIVQKIFSHPDEEGFALNLSKNEFAVKKLGWSGFDIHSKRYSLKLSVIDAIKNLTIP